MTMLNARQVADQLGVALTTIYEWCRLGRLKASVDEQGQKSFESNYIQQLDPKEMKRKRGRKYVKEGESTVRRGFSANESLISKFDEEAQRIGIKGSEMFRIMNEVYFKNVDTEPMDKAQ